jgi:hypothetical protein
MRLSTYYGRAQTHAEIATAVNFNACFDFQYIELDRSEDGWTPKASSQ